MPRLQYAKYKPKPVAASVIRTCDEILTRYARRGMDLTLRQLHYQLVAHDLYPDEWIDAAYNRKMGLDPNTKNTQKNYDRLGNIVSRAREAGMLDWDHIKDRGRSVSKFPHWGDPADFIKKVTKQFNLDMWEDQPKRVEVWVEKDALSQVIEQAADPFDVPTFATKGYMSSSSAWDAAHNRFRKWADREQEVVIIHLADHDPSGVHMTKDVEERIELYGRGYRDEHKPLQLQVERLALTLDQVEEHNPPPNPAKESDSRMPAYVAEFGITTSWELDALDPEVLVNMIQDAIQSHLDMDLYNARRAQEEHDEEMLKTVADHWDAVVELLEDIA